MIRLAQLDFEDEKAEFSAETDRLRKELRDRLAEFGCEDIDEFAIMYGEYRRTASELEALDNVYRAFLGSDDIHKLIEEAENLKIVSIRQSPPPQTRTNYWRISKGESPRITIISPR